MKAVTGSVESSQRINLSKAASVLSQFAASAGEPLGAGEYVRRASCAVDELMQLGLDVGLCKRQKKKKRDMKNKERRGFLEDMEETVFDSTGEVVDLVRKKHRSEK